MSDDPILPDGSLDPGVLPAHVSALTLAGMRATQAAADFVSGGVRIDDRTAAVLDAAMRTIVAGIERIVRAATVRTLDAKGHGALATQVATGDPVFARVHAAGLFRDPALFGEVLGRVRLDLLSAAMPIGFGNDPERPDMLARLVQSSDALVATAAVRLIAVQGRRAQAHGTDAVIDLPPAMRRHIGWWVAAALRDAHRGDAGDDLAILDTALSGAVAQVGDDTTPSLIGAASLLAAAIDPATDELPPLIEQAVADRHAVLLIALVAHAAAIDTARVRDIVTTVGDGRLWVLLRAVDLPRATIARIGFALSEADRARDVEAFADSLDAIMAIAPAVARAAIAPLSLAPEYHAAMLALEQAS